MLKNSELASARAISVSPATDAACVRASRVNGVTTNAAAPSRRRAGFEMGCHPLSDDITGEGTSVRAGHRRTRRPIRAVSPVYGERVAPTIQAADPNRTPPGVL